MIKKIDHIAIAVHDLDSSLKFYTDVLGLQNAGIEEIADQKVRLAMLPIGDTHIELLEPTTEDSPIAKFLEKKGEGMHHIAFRVENLAGELIRMEEMGVELIDKTVKTGAGGNQVAFLHPKSTFGVLMELSE
ncbi:methylmalonyl-CoA epimerase [candidate division KSB1 bacterium]|nr:methylmalonyl-CoA epimerase [candidate division KSB1 bacterium]